jgi:hypothetical protein
MCVELSMVCRWHSTLPDTFVYRGKALPTEASLWNNQILIAQGLGPMFEAASAQPVGELQSIELGRKAQLAGYNGYRKMCKLPRHGFRSNYRRRRRSTRTQAAALRTRRQAAALRTRRQQ